MIRKSTFCSFLVLLLFIFLNTANAQNTGQIQGAVTDSTTGEGLTGANLFLEGTSLGVATDAKGNFRLTNIPPNSYTLIARYIGYRQKEIQVNVVAGKTIELDIILPNEVIEGTPVVVTAQAVGQRGAINEQLTSNTIKNIVSAEKIRQLPDANAATALSRLSGVSLMNGDQVVIRGIQAKQNLILVNGIQLPSTDINTRATNLGFISSNMLSGIEVTKVPTPDMDANAIGGTVNLRLREAPENFHFDLLSQGSLNHQDRTWDNYQFWASASDRYFDNKLGVLIQGNANRLNGGNDQTTATYGISQGLPYGQAPYAMNNFTFNDQVNIVSSAGGSLILDYRLPHGSLLLQNTLSQGAYNMATFNNQFDFTGNRIVYSISRDKNFKNLMVNALQTEYNFGDIKSELTLSHSYSDKSTSVRFGDAGDNTNFQNTTDPAPWGYDAGGQPISYGTARYTLTPAQVLNININPDNYKGAILQDWAVLRSQAFKEHIYNAKLDFTLPLSFSDIISSEFKIGGKFTRTTRNNDLNEWYKRTGDANFYTSVSDFIPGKTLSNTSPILFTDVQNKDYENERGQYYLDGTYDFKYAFNIDQMSDFYTLAKIGWGSAVHQAGSEQNDFNGAEIFSAGYLMGSFNIGPDLSIIGGARLEHYNMDYKATFFYVTHPVDGNGVLYDTLNNSNRSDDHIFPGVQVRYKFTDWCDLRLAYTQTVSRPDYQAILPNVFFTPGLTSQAGNPKLNPAISTNYDAYLSFYTNEIGLLTVGGFYKKMKDVFYPTTIYYQNLSHYNASFPDSATWRALGITPPSPSDQISSYINNPAPAYVKGLEFEWQTNFWYLPNPLNSLVLNINYTRVWSEMDYLQVRNISQSYIYIDPVTGRRFTRFRYLSIDTTRTARLLNQGDDILNIALGVDYKGFSGRISFNMQGNVITSVGSRPETDQFTHNIYRWDFTLKQQLPIEGLSISLSGVNIFHNATVTYSKFRRTIDGPIFDNELSTLYTPRIFEFNLRYTL
jgi:TonB-dependent receptor